jgi:hypothetical protein
VTSRPAFRRPLGGPLLFARSRGIPLTVASLAAIALLAVWGAHGLDAYLEPSRRVPVVALAPLLAAAVIGTGLHPYTDELDRTAVRPWWTWRLAQVLGLTALAATLLAFAVLGHTAEFGAPAMARNALGAMGITAATAVVIDARLSWLPAFAYLSAIYLGSGRVRGSGVEIWAWPMQPGPEPGAWAAALALFVAGTSVYEWRGPSREK